MVCQCNTQSSSSTNQQVGYDSLRVCSFCFTFVCPAVCAPRYCVYWLVAHPCSFEPKPKPRLQNLRPKPKFMLQNLNPKPDLKTWTLTQIVYTQSRISKTWTLIQTQTSTVPNPNKPNININLNQTWTCKSDVVSIVVTSVCSLLIITFAEANTLLWMSYGSFIRLAPLVITVTGGQTLHRDRSSWLCHSSHW